MCDLGYEKNLLISQEVSLVERTEKMSNSLILELEKFDTIIKYNKNYN